uniref:Uncharacterized protein n=1 Tax=Anopheles dirus TaxID=7168 RepID=A0A182NYS9_9DIPT
MCRRRHCLCAAPAAGRTTTGVKSAAVKILHTPPDARRHERALALERARRTLPFRNRPPLDKHSVWMRRTPAARAKKRKKS